MGNMALSMGMDFKIRKTYEFCKLIIDDYIEWINFCTLG